MARINFLEENSYELIRINNIPGLFTNERIKKETLPACLNMYEIRMDDDGQDFATFENKVLVNFAGTFITKQPVEIIRHEEVNKDDYYTEIEDYTFENEYETEDWRHIYMEKTNACRSITLITQYFWADEYRSWLESECTTHHIIYELANLRKIIEPEFELIPDE